MLPFIPEFRRLFPELERTWIVLGKGPSLEAYKPDPNTYVMGINHTAAITPVDVAHVVDIEVLSQCGSRLLETARYLLMPWIPHTRHPPSLLTPRMMMDASGVTLGEWSNIDPVLGRFAAQNRLLFYNLETAPEAMRHKADTHVVNVTYFSASAAINLLARSGCRRIRTYGIDGGTEYDARFQSLAETTRLANGQAAFDLQFQGIVRTMAEYGLDLAPGNLETPIRIFVGSEPQQELALKVLEHSLRRYATMSIKVEPLYQAIQDKGISIPAPSRPDLKARTPFSYQRFAIPALKGYSGRAIYLDSDMQVFDDIKKLWTMEFDGAPILAVAGQQGSGRRPQFSVMLLDCQALDWDISRLIGELEAGKWTYEEFMFEMAAAPGARAAIPSRWNELERYQPGQTALLHYTDMEQQPWLEATNPIGHVWCKELMEAIVDGTIGRDFVAEEVSRGNVRPSLLAQIDQAIVDPLTLPHALRKLDKGYLPPHALPVERKSLAPLSLWKIRTVRSSRSIAWRTLNSLGLWSAAKALRQKIKVWRQNKRIRRERRRRRLPNVT